MNPSATGLRRRALAEIVLALALALLWDLTLGGHDRYASWSPHPFWIVVVLAASYYGSRLGLAAVLLASAALLVGHLPLQGLDEDTGVWLMRALALPLAWCVAAMVLGLIRDASRARLAGVRAELAEADAQRAALDLECRRLQRANHRLETRVAGQQRTVPAMYAAARAIERQGVGEVLLGTVALVRAVMNPDRYSLFLHAGTQLEAAAAEGWSPDDPWLRVIGPESPLYQAVVVERRDLVIGRAADEQDLAGQGLMAGPIVNGETGRVVGMLKIEAIGFLDLSLASTQHFRVLCDWIGAALANAQRVEDLRATPVRETEPA